MTLFFKDNAEATQAQRDLLWTLETSKNSLLKPSTIPSKNERLDTNSKRVIGAINEVSLQQKTVYKTVQVAMEQMSTYVGDIFSEGTADAKMLEEMNAKNLVDAIRTIRKDSEPFTVIDGGRF